MYSDPQIPSNIVRLEDVRQKAVLRAEFDIHAAINTARYIPFRHVFERAMDFFAAKILMPLDKMFPPQPVETFSQRALLNMTAKPGFSRDIETPGRHVFAAYTDQGRNMVYRLDVCGQGRTLSFYHGTLDERSGDFLELRLERDGRYHILSRYRIEGGMVEYHYRSAHDLPCRLLGEIVPAMNRQGREMRDCATTPSHLRLVRPPQGP